MFLQLLLLFRKPKRGLDHFLALFQMRFRRIWISRLQVGLSQFVLGSDVKRIAADGLFQVDDRRIQFPFVERQDSPELERFRGGSRFGNLSINFRQRFRMTAFHSQKL